MLFNSFAFLVVFLPLTFGGYFLLARLRLLVPARIYLVLASVIFYGMWDWRYVPLLASSIIFNYVVGERILLNRGTSSSRCWLTFGIICDLALLMWFKYTDFLIGSANSFLGATWEPLGLMLPLGISFFTFTQIAYLVDAWRGDVVRSGPMTYALFVTYFPHLIAGPIIHHRSMIPQFLAVRNFAISQRNLAIGLSWFTLGLAKKMLIADPLAGLADPAFAHAQHAGTGLAWVGVLAYSLQLYFDFSGYSDMAIGLGRCLNHELPLNFASPYKATSIGDFWRRWHISLSIFLRDYLYIPLGGSRVGRVREVANVLVTMLLGGLWHGAGWTFVVWGGLHGLYLVVYHGWRRLGISLPTAVAWPLTLIAVIVGWVFFRASSLTDASALIAAMCGHGGGQAWSWTGKDLALLCTAGAIALFCPNTQALMAGFRTTWPWLVAILGLLLASITRFGGDSPFLYYQF